MGWEDLSGSPCTLTIVSRAILTVDNREIRVNPMGEYQLMDVMIRVEFEQGDQFGPRN